MPTARSPRAAAGQRSSSPKACGFQRRCPSTPVLRLDSLGSAKWFSPGSRPDLQPGGGRAQGMVVLATEGSHVSSRGSHTIAVTLSPRSGGLAPAEVSGRPEPQEGTDLISPGIRVSVHIPRKPHKTRGLVVPGLEDLTGPTAPTAQGERQGPKFPQTSPSWTRTPCHLPLPQPRPIHSASAAPHALPGPAEAAAKLLRPWVGDPRPAGLSWSGVWRSESVV